MRDPVLYLADPVQSCLLFRMLIIENRCPAESQGINLIKNALLCLHILFHFFPFLHLFLFCYFI